MALSILHDRNFFLSLSVDTASDTSDSWSWTQSATVYGGENAPELAIWGGEKSYDNLRVELTDSGDLVDRHSAYWKSFEQGEEYTNLNLESSRVMVADDDDNLTAYNEHWAIDDIERVNTSLSMNSYNNSAHSCWWNGRVHTVVSSFGNDYFFSLFHFMSNTTSMHLIKNKISGKGSRNYLHTPSIDENYFLTLSPRLQVIENFGLCLFHFEATEELTGSPYDRPTKEFVVGMVYDDEKNSWSEFMRQELDPFYGPSLRPEEFCYTRNKTASLKVSYENGKLVLGTMLQAQDDPTPHAREMFSEMGNSSEDQTLVITSKYKIVKNSLKIYTRTQTGSMSYKAEDDGAGTIVQIGTYGVTGTVDYESGLVTVQENSNGVFEDGQSIHILYVPDTFYANRILNLMVSKDLGKSFVTVPIEFLSNAWEGQLPAGNDYLLGDERQTNKSETYGIPAGFGLGYDQYSDKFVVMFRGPGYYQSPDEPYSVVNNNSEKITFFNSLARLCVYYNKNEDLSEWDSDNASTDKAGSRIEAMDEIGDTYGYSNEEVVLSNSWIIFDYPSTHNPPSHWKIEGGIISQLSNIYDLNHMSSLFTRSTHAIYNLESDPTFGRIRAISFEGYPIDDDAHGLIFMRQDNDNYYAVVFDNQNASGDNYSKIYLKKVSSGTETELFNDTVFMPLDSWYTVLINFNGSGYINLFLNDVFIKSFQDADFNNGKVAFLSGGMTGIRYRNLKFYDQSIYKTFVGESFGRISTNIDYHNGSDFSGIELFQDNNGNSWMLSNISMLNYDVRPVAGGVPDNDIYNGQALTPWRLNRTIERKDGKFLGLNKYELLTGPKYNKDHGFNTNPSVYGIVNSQNTAKTKKTFGVESAFFSEDSLRIYLRSSNNSGYVRTVGLIAKRSTLPVLCQWCEWYAPLTDNNVGSYSDSGWAYSGGSATTKNESYLSYEFATGAYYYQNYDITADSVDSIVSPHTFLKHIDLNSSGSGFAIHFKTRSPDPTNYTSSRVIAEFHLPYNKMLGNNCLEFRLEWQEALNASIPPQLNVKQRILSSSWGNVTAVPVKISTDYSDFSEFLFIIYPINSSLSYIRIATKLESDTEWVTNYAPISSYNAFADEPKVMFGSLSNLSGTASGQQFKGVVSLAKNVFVNYGTEFLRGESFNSGTHMSLRSPPGYTQHRDTDAQFAIANGIGVKGSKWLLTSTPKSYFPSSTIIRQDDTYWKSADDLSDYTITVDFGHEIEMDCVLLSGLNTCGSLYVKFLDANNTWIGGVNLDTTVFNDQFSYSTYPQFGTVVGDPISGCYYNNINGNSLYNDDELSGKIAYFENSKASRIIENKSNILRFGEISGLLNFEGDISFYDTRVMAKLRDKKYVKSIQITFYGSGVNSVTPDGYFTLERVMAGVLDTIEEPYQKMSITRTANDKRLKLASGQSVALPEKKSTRNFSFTFTKVDDREFGKRLEWLHRNISQGYQVAITENAEEQWRVHSAFSVQQWTTTDFSFCQESKIMKKSTQTVNLFDFTLSLKESR